MGLIDEPNFEVLTLLNLEMRLTTKYLDGRHSTFKKLSRDDRSKLIIFDEIETKREDYLFNKRKLEMETKNAVRK